MNNEYLGELHHIMRIRKLYKIVMNRIDITGAVKRLVTSQSYCCVLLFIVFPFVYFGCYADDDDNDDDVAVVVQ